MKLINFDLNISYNRVVISYWVYYKVQPSKRGAGGGELVETGVIGRET